MGHRVVRSLPNDFPILRNGHFHAPLLLIGHAKVHAGGKVARVELHGLAVGLNGQLRLAGPLVDLAEEIVGVGELRRQGCRLAVPIHRLLGLARLGQEQPGHEVDRRLLRVGLGEFLDPGPDRRNVGVFLEPLGVGLPGFPELAEDQLRHILGKVGARIVSACPIELADPCLCPLGHSRPVGMNQSVGQSIQMVRVRRHGSAEAKYSIGRRAGTIRPHTGAIKMAKFIGELSSVRYPRSLDDHSCAMTL